MLDLGRRVTAEIAAIHSPSSEDCQGNLRIADKVSFRRARTKVRIWVGASEQQSQRCAQNRGDKQNTNDAPVQLKSQ